jgi:hypothetical protein
LISDFSQKAGFAADVSFAGFCGFCGLFDFSTPVRGKSPSRQISNRVALSTYFPNFATFSAGLLFTGMVSAVKTFL